MEIRGSRLYEEGGEGVGGGGGGRTCWLLPSAGGFVVDVGWRSLGEAYLHVWLLLESMHVQSLGGNAPH